MHSHDKEHSHDQRHDHPGPTSRGARARRAQAQATLPGTFQISLERAFSRKKEISIIFSGYKVIEVLSWSLDFSFVEN